MSIAIEVLYVGLPEPLQRKLDAVRRQYESLRMPDVWIRRTVSERALAMREGRE